MPVLCLRIKPAVSSDAAFTETSTEFYQRRNPGLQSMSWAPRSNIGACSPIPQSALQPSIQPRSSTPPYVHSPLAHLLPLSCSDIHKGWGEIPASLQLPSINAKCWPSNETLITSCSSPHTPKCSALTSEPLSAAPALARGSNYSCIPLRTRDWFQSAYSSSTAPR